MERQYGHSENRQREQAAGADQANSQARTTKKKSYPQWQEDGYSARTGNRREPNRERQRRGSCVQAKGIKQIYRDSMSRIRWGRVPIPNDPKRFPFENPFVPTNRKRKRRGRNARDFYQTRLKTSPFEILRLRTKRCLITRNQWQTISFRHRKRKTNENLYVFLDNRFRILRS